MPAKKPAVFVPEFREDLTVSVGGRETRINPLMCATPETADALIGLFKEHGIAAVIIQGQATNSWPRFGGPVAFSDTVPWLGFLDNFDGSIGTRINAGILASSFTHGYPLDYATKYMLREYRMVAFENGFGEQPSPFWL
jgi:hypothetical protein